MRRIVSVVVLVWLCTGLASSSTDSAWLDPAHADAEPMPLASSSLLLDAVLLDGGRVLAVGERGHIVWSDDHGVSWQQAPVPTRSTLTSIAAHGDIVIAAGHDGVIVRSGDAGLNWQRVREDVFEPGSFDPANGAPLLDLLFLDDDRVLAIGAYSLLLTSDDGGESWQPGAVIGAADGSAEAEVATGSDDEDAGSGDPLLFDQADLVLDDEEDPHLNAITRLPDGRLFIVAERGSAFLSDDDGGHWRRVSLPYDGSMFGVLSLGGPRLLAYGLRGNVQHSEDGGESWRELDTGTELSLFGGFVRNTGVVLVGANGLVLETGSGPGEFLGRTVAEAGVLAAVIEAADGSLLAFGEHGIRRIVTSAGERP